jgi:hypothetical protein
MKIRKRLALSLGVLLCFAGVAEDRVQIMDGVFWQSLNVVEKLRFVHGLTDAWWRDEW